MARIIFMGVDVSKEALDISINGKHKRIANVSDAISKFIAPNRKICQTRKKLSNLSFSSF
uniref:hypothetical protein n=1 Tax=Wolbachia endosymbiont (group A) of Gymnosoma rotundatum TaxID=2954016 RepID=UPI0022268555|nr:hypothetical protein [Wolbachia endosymbiont (group A) of Gymnosoma rotundatum]